MRLQAHLNRCGSQIICYDDDDDDELEFNNASTLLGH